MNKVFKVIWNHATQTWTAVSELGHAKGKTKSKKIVKLTALAGAVIGSLAVSQTATAAADLTTNDAVNIAPNNVPNPTAGREAVAVGPNAGATHQHSIAIGRNATAKWTNAISIGKDTVSSQDHAIAMGTSSNASGIQAVGVGSYTKAEGNLVVAVGPYAQANKEAAIAVGSNATAAETNSVAVGQTATASNNNAIAVGTKTVSRGDNAIGIGAYAESTAHRATAIGVLSQANGEGSFAGGASAHATGTNSVAIGGAMDGTPGDKAGTAAKAIGNQSIAVGTKSKAVEENTIAQGNTATANKESDIAIGTSSVANGTRQSKTSCDSTEKTTSSSLPGGAKGNDSCPDGTAIAVGKNSNATGYSAISVGKDSSASYDHAIAIGDTASATKIHSVAIGSAASADGDGAFAGGYNATSAGKNSLALGFNAQSTYEDAVALGSKSITEAPNKTPSMTFAGKTINFAGGNPASVVSVGSKDNERQITNVAAGRISDTSTDAINGSQLYAVAEKLGKGWNLKTKPNNSAEKTENGESTTTEENIAPDENVTLIAGKNIKLKQTGGDVLIATKDDVIFNTANIGGIKINTGGIQMNNQQITGLAAGQVNSTSKDAVNGSQLYNNPFIFQGFNGNTGKGDQVSTDYIYRPGVENPKLQLVALNGLKMTADTNNTYKLQIDTESDLYKGLKGQDGKDGKGVTATVTNNGDGTHTLTVTNSDGSTSTTVINDGKSIKGRVDNNGDGTHTITIEDETDGSVTTTIVKDGKDGKDGKNAKAEVTKNADGSHTITIVDGDGKTTSTIVKNGDKGEKGDPGEKGEKGDAGATGARGSTIEVTVDDDDKNGTHTIKFTDMESGSVTTTIVKDGKNGKDGKDGATGATGAAGPEKHVDVVSGNENTTKVEVKPNASKDGRDRFVVSANTTTTKVNDNGTVSVDPKGNDGNLVNATTVVNAINDASFNVTTGKHVDEVVTDTAAGSVQSKVRPGSTVTITSGKNVAVNQTGTTFTISTTADVTHNNVTANNIVATNVTAGDVTAENVTANNVTTKNITVENGGNIDMGGNQVHNVANGTNPTDAVNLSQLNATKTVVKEGNQTKVTATPNATTGGTDYKVDVNTTALSNITNTGKITVPDANTVGNKGLVTAIDVANAINAAYWKVGDNAGAVKHNVTAGSQVNFVNGNATSSNVTVDANGLTKVSYNVNAGDGLHIDSNNKLVANVTDIKQGDNVVVNKDSKGVYTISANNTQASVSTDPNKGITVTPTVNANGTTNYKVTVDVDNDTITVNNQGKLVATPNGSTNFNVSTSNAGNKVANKDSAPKTTHITGGKTINYAAGKNIAIEQDNGNILISTTENVNHNSVTTNDLTVNKGGNVDMGGNQVHNVKAGTKDTDAVNVSQLRSNVTNLNNRINKVGKEARGGIAGANAAAGLPQVYIPGKSMVAASAGTFKGESAVAVGYSRSSDNGKVIFKLQGNANTQGDVGGSVGVGYQW